MSGWRDQVLSHLNETARKLRYELEQVEKTIAVVKELDSGLNQNDGKEVGPTEAIKMLFENQPNKKWRPSEIITKLQILVETGKIKFTTERTPELFVHSSLGSLTKSKYLIKRRPHPKKSIAYYVKNPDYAKKRGNGDTSLSN